jgi:hypothetical protein
MNSTTLCHDPPGKMNAAPVPHERAAKKLLPLKGTEQARLLINDGTNSVIEFLRSAKDALPRDRVLPVLLVEIRNSDDIDDTQVPTPTPTRPTLFFSPTHQANRTNPDPERRFQLHHRRTAASSTYWGAPLIRSSPSTISSSTTSSKSPIRKATNSTRRTRKSTPARASWTSPSPGT